jgi:uncharacterized protein
VRTASSVAYLDSSALVKLVVDENETGVLRRAVEAWPRRVSSNISLVEVLRAVRRRDPSAEALAHIVLTHTRLMAVADGVLVRAAQLDQPPLRALDAIHVASALRLGPSLSAFVSYDALQLEAAEALGLPVVAPR